MSKKIKIILILLLSVGIICVVAAAIYKKPNRQNVITPQDAGERVEGIVNKYFMQGKNAAISKETVEESGLYKVNLKIGESVQDFYLTRDGSRLIFPNGIIDIAKFEESTKKDLTKKETPKREKPLVELYVMSLCPYGVKAEKEILPVMNSFKAKADFKIKYIVAVKGDTLNDVSSLHGADEVKENLRQAAIMKYYPDKFSTYIDKINKNFCLISCGEIKVDEYWKKAALELRMDAKKIESFVSGQEGFNLLKQDAADSKNNMVEGSPTLLINGVKSDSIFLGAKEMQEAICSAFSVSPDECQKRTETGL